MNRNNYNTKDDLMPIIEIISTFKGTLNGYMIENEDIYYILIDWVLIVARYFPKLSKSYYFISQLHDICNKYAYCDGTYDYNRLINLNNLFHDCPPMANGNVNQLCFNCGEEGIDTLFAELNQALADGNYDSYGN